MANDKAYVEPKAVQLNVQESHEPNFDGEAPDFSESKDIVDGGSRAWIVLAGSSCIIYATYGLLASNGLFLNYWVANQLSRYSSSEVAWITAAHVFLALFTGGQAGVLFDKYGHAPLLLPGSIMYILGFFLTGECNEFWQFMLAYSVLSGVGCGIASSVAINLVVQWFDQRLGLAMGIIFMFSSVGGLTFPLMMRKMFQSLSWENCMRIFGCIVAVMLIIGNICVRRRVMTRLEGTVNLKDFIDLRFISVTVGLGMFEFTLFGALGLLPEIAQFLNYSLSTRFNIVAVMNVCSGIGRVTCGAIADKLGCYNVILFSASCSLLSVLTFWLLSRYSVVLLYLFAANFGFWSGSALSIGPACVARLCKTEQYGQYYGTSYSITSFVNLICVPMGSKLLHLLGMKLFACFFGAILFLCVVSLSVTRWIVLGRTWKWLHKV